MSSTPPNTDERSHASLGATLSQLRQARGLSTDDVSVRLKYTAIQIQDLEAENWEVLPSGTPLRWMIKSYARFLEADEDSVLQLLNEQPTGAKRAHPGRAAANWNQTEMALYSEPTQRSWGWWLVIIILIVVAVFYALDQGWIPEEWLLFDWLKGFNS